MVTNPLDLFFALVPQNDRRQVLDRRRVWRSGRRASDVAPADASVGREIWVIGSDSSGDRHVATKPVLH